MIRHHASARAVTVVMALVGLIILAAAVYRAASASFTHDEAFSYNYYLDLSYGEILIHTHAFTNNHILNTFGMKLCKQLFGPAEVALRLPNLLALVLFLYYAALLLRRMPPWLGIAGFVVLGTNSYMLELFTLARGYGLSFGFALMALFHLVRAVQKMRTRDVVLFHVASTLATLSNFTLLNVHLTGLAVLYVLVLMRVSKGGILWKRLAPFTIANVMMVVISAAVLWLPIRHMLQQNALDFGGKGGFFSSTASTWILSFFPRLHFAGPIMVVLYALVVLIALSGLVVTIRRYWRGDVEFFEQDTVLPAVTLIPILTYLMVEVEHYGFGVDRLYERFALFLVPYLVLLTAELLAVLHARGWRKGTNAIIALASLWSVFACSRNFGPYHSVEWQYDVRTKDVVTAIAMDMRDSDHQRHAVHVGVNWLFEPTMNYYLDRMKLDVIQPVGHDGLSATDDYRVEFDEEENSIVADGYRRMEVFPESGVTLFKRVDDPDLSSSDMAPPQ